jgi:hypothetical protein
MNDFTRELKLIDLEQLLKKVPNKPLGDAEINVRLIEGKVEYTLPIECEEITFSVGAFSNAEIFVFNSPDDEDPAGVIGIPPGQSEGIELLPQITLNKDNAYLKYQFNASVKASGGASLSSIAFDIDGEKSVIFSDYHVHKQNTNVREAIKNDLINIRFAASLQDVLSLNKNEALAFQVRGKLSTQVEISWADVFCSNLNKLCQFLSTHTLLAIKTGLGASVTANVCVTDDFLLIFSRPQKGKIRVALKKTEQSKSKTHAGLQVHVEFAKPDDVTKVLNDALEGILGDQIKIIDNLFKKTSLSALSDRERELVEKLLDRLGLDDEFHNIEKLKKRWIELTQGIEETIEDIAKSKIGLGFKYEYQRIASESTVFQVVLLEDQIRKYHLDLLKRNLGHLMDWMKSNPGKFELENYLHEKSLVKRRAWGFSLGFGKWMAAGKDIKEYREISRENFEGNKMLSFKGVRSYEGKWLSDKLKWVVDFKADMDVFSSGTPIADEFDYGLYLKWIWSEKKLSKDEILNYIDHAIIWHALDNDDKNDVLAHLEDIIDRKAKVEVSLDLKFDNETLREILPLAYRGMKKDFARALAAAMPWESKFEARQIIERRVNLYTPLWYFYLNNSHLTPRDFASVAGQHLRKTSEGKNIARVESVWPNVAMITFAEMIRLNAYNGRDYKGILEKWLKFQSAIRILHYAIEHQRNYTKIAKIFENMEPLFSQSLFVRAVGVFLLNFATKKEDLLEQVERTFMVRDERGDQQVVFTTS